MSNASESIGNLILRSELEDAFNHRLKFADAHQNDIVHVNALLKLHFWLADSKPPTAGSWLTFTTQLKTQDDAAESLFDMTRRMVRGDFWRKQLHGWKEIVACILAALYMQKDDIHIRAADRIRMSKKSYNDALRKAMWERDFRKGEHEPHLEDMPRRDVCDESRWQLIHAWLNENCQQVYSMLLEECIDRGPHRALALLKQLDIPPGFKSSAEQKEAERLQRAMDAEKDDDFDIGDVVDEASDEESDAREPVLCMARAEDTEDPVELRKQLNELIHQYDRLVDDYTALREKLLNTTGEISNVLTLTPAPPSKRQRTR